jgi:hypothetical protein
VHLTYLLFATFIAHATPPSRIPEQEMAESHEVCVSRTQRSLQGTVSKAAATCRRSTPGKLIEVCVDFSAARGGAVSGCDAAVKKLAGANSERELGKD